MEKERVAPMFERKRKKDAKSMAEVEMEQVDVVYHYGGGKAIKLSGYSTPINVLEAYEELKKIREEKGDEFLLEEALISIQMDSDVKRSISDVF